MNCAYCHIAVQPGEMRCQGCGAPSTMRRTEPSVAAAEIYEKIGRAVVNRATVNPEPNDALDRLVSIGERKDASPHEQKIARVAKVIFCLFILWQFPMILALILPLGMMFFIWVYLPYMGLKKLMSWLSS